MVKKDSFYADTEAFIHQLTKIFFILTLGGSFMYGFCPFLVVFYNLAADTYSMKSWSLHYNNVWLPFELNSAARFTGVNVIQSMSCWTGTTILITIVSMYFGIILYIQAFLKDFTFFFDEMDTFAELNDLSALKDKFDALIKFHVYVLEYVLNNLHLILVEFTETI